MTAEIPQGILIWGSNKGEEYIFSGERKLRQTQRGLSAPVQLLELFVDYRKCALSLDSELRESIWGTLVMRAKAQVYWGIFYRLLVR